jgi:hypothetical protein
MPAFPTLNESRSHARESCWSLPVILRLSKAGCHGDTTSEILVFHLKYRVTVVLLYYSNRRRDLDRDHIIIMWASLSPSVKLPCGSPRGEPSLSFSGYNSVMFSKKSPPPPPPLSSESLFFSESQRLGAVFSETVNSLSRV